MGHFLLFYHPPPNSPKNQNFKKIKEKDKRSLEISSFHKCTKNHDHMLATLLLRYDSDKCNCYFSFWAIFCPFTPIIAQKIKIFKKWKKHLQAWSFFICVPKFMIRWCTVPEIWCATDGQTDGRKKWHKEMGAPPKNNVKIVESKFKNQKSQKSVERKLQFLW